MGVSDEGFIQDYDLGQKQELYIYCRLCRTTFPVRFRPKSSRVRIQCMCGSEGPLSELDVFRTHQAARDHADFYEKVYRAAVSALDDAGIPVPPSGKYRKVADVRKDPEFKSFYSEEEDDSAIKDGYLEPDSDVARAGVASMLAQFEARLEQTTDLLARHELLSRMVEWTYCRRHLDSMAHRRFREACQEDVEIAGQVIRLAKEFTRRGHKVKLRFTSFKHYLIDLTEEGELETALAIAERAAALGLKGYDSRAAELRAKLGLTA